MRRGAIVLLVASFCLCVVGYVLYSLRAVNVANARTLEGQQLLVSQRILQRGTVPYAWSAAIYIPSALVQNVLNVESETIVSVPDIPNFGTVELTFRSATLEPQVDGLHAVLKIGLRSRSRNVSLDLAGRGLIGYRGVYQGDGDTRVAKFGILITELKADLSWGVLNFRTPSLLRELAAAGVMRRFGSQFEFSVPIGQPLAASVNVNRVQHIPIAATGGSVDIHFGMLKSQLALPDLTLEPLFLTHGVWLLASSGSPSPDSTPPVSPTDTEIRALRKTVNQLAAHIPEKDPGALAIWIDWQLIAGMVNKFNQLPPPARQVNVESVGTTGKLYTADWHGGGLWVEPTNTDFLHGQAKIEPLQTKWLPKRGLQIDSTISATIDANVNWNFNPGVGGGGIGSTSYGLSGNANLTLSAQTMAALQNIDGHAIALFQVLPRCVNAPVQIGDRGALKLTVKTSVQAFSTPLSPIILFDSLPQQFEIGASLDVGSADSSKVRVDWAAPYLNATFVPVVAETGEVGFYLAAAAKLERGSKGGIGLSITQERSRIVALAQAATPDPTCPNTGDVRVEIAGVELGPNGVIIQLVGAAADVVKRTGQEIQKIYTTPGKAAEDFPGNVVREVHNFFSHL